MYNKYSVDNLPEPFINYEGEFLNNKDIKTYDCITDGSYLKKKSL